MVALTTGVENFFNFSLFLNNFRFGRFLIFEWFKFGKEFIIFKKWVSKSKLSQKVKWSWECWSQVGREWELPTDRNRQSITLNRGDLDLTPSCVSNSNSCFFVSLAGAFYLQCESRELQGCIGDETLVVNATARARRRILVARVSLSNFSNCAAGSAGSNVERLFPVSTVLKLRGPN